jgi:hypothetical protein
MNTIWILCPICSFDFRGLAASRVEAFATFRSTVRFSVFRVVATEEGNEECALRRPCGRNIGDLEMETYVPQFVYVFPVKAERVGGGGGVDCSDKALIIAKAVPLSVSWASHPPPRHRCCILSRWLANQLNPEN